MTTDDQNTWREKYLQSLDEIDRTQAAATQEIQMLRKALVRVSLAADGLDPSLDEAMGALREQLRLADSHRLPGTIEQAETAVLSFEKRRVARSEQQAEALGKLYENFYTAAQSRDQKKQLAQHRAVIDDVAKGSGDITPLLNAMVASYQATEENKPEKSGLLGRLFAGKDEAQAKEESLDISSEDIESSNERVVDAATTATSAAVDTAIIRENEASDLVEIKQEIIRILKELLENIEPVEGVVELADSARERLRGALLWSELPLTLAEIRDLVMRAYLAAGAEFGNYLQQVDLALVEISKALGIAIGEQQNGLEYQQEFDQEMSSQLVAIGQTVEMAEDLNKLKEQVNAHISVIHEALDKKKNQQQSSGNDLAEQLSQLVSQVKAIEQEAHLAKEDLAKQRHKAMTDTLTELPNREAYNERIDVEFQRWQRYKRPLTLAVCDVDHFKRINDTYGHQAGDRVLKMLARSIRKRLREVDFIARYGGEEFVMLLPETTGENALQALNAVREGIAAMPLKFKDTPIKMTVSMGVAEFKEGDTVEQVFANADALLYKAKEAGRNRCLLVAEE